MGLILFVSFFTFCFTEFAFAKDEDDFQGLFKVEYGTRGIMQKSVFLPTLPSPLKLQKGYFFDLTLKADDFYAGIDIIKKTIADFTPSYTQYIPIPIKDDKGRITGFYTSGKDKNLHLMEDLAKKQDLKTAMPIAVYGWDVFGIREGTAENCKVFIKYNSMMGLLRQNKQSSMLLWFQIAIAEDNKCQVDIETVGEKLFSAFKESLKKSVAINEKKSIDGSLVSLRDINTALTINCAAGNKIACPVGMVVSTFRILTEFATMDFHDRDKEEKNIRNQCIEAMKDKNAAVISMDDNIEIKCIKEGKLVKARFFKNNVLEKQVVRMEPDSKVSQTQ